MLYDAALKHFTKSGLRSKNLASLRRALGRNNADKYIGQMRQELLGATRFVIDKEMTELMTMAWQNYPPKSWNAGLDLTKLPYSYMWIEWDLHASLKARNQLIANDAPLETGVLLTVGKIKETEDTLTLQPFSGPNATNKTCTPAIVGCTWATERPINLGRIISQGIQGRNHKDNQQHLDFLYGSNYVANNPDPEDALIEAAIPTMREEFLNVISNPSNPYQDFFENMAKLEHIEFAGDFAMTYMILAAINTVRLGSGQPHFVGGPVKMTQTQPKRGNEVIHVTLETPRLVEHHDMVGRRPVNDDPIRKRWHQVRGHFRHNRNTDPNCAHVWIDIVGKAQQWHCSKCGGKRWWANAHARGDKTLGIIDKIYQTTIAKLKSKWKNF